MFSKNEWNKKSYSEFIKYIEAMSDDEEYKKFTSGLIPGKEGILGIRIPKLREIARDISKGNWREFLKLSYENDLGYMEEEMIRAFVIGNIKAADINEVIGYIDEFADGIDCWSVNDSFCASLKITKKYKAEMYDFITENLKSESPWRKRFSIVMLLDYYIEEDYIDDIFEICEKVRDEEYYYKMAVAWLLSICFIKLRYKTLEYLKTSTLDDFTYNKALQKTRESLRVSREDKELLKNMKR